MPGLVDTLMPVSQMHILLLQNVPGKIHDILGIQKAKYCQFISILTCACYFLLYQNLVYNANCLLLEKFFLRCFFFKSLIFEDQFDNFIFKIKLLSFFSRHFQLQLPVCYSTL
jgi:hypothetical protein